MPSAGCWEDHASGTRQLGEARARWRPCPRQTSEFKSGRNFQFSFPEGEAVAQTTKHAGTQGL